MFKVNDWVRLKYSYAYEKPNKIIEIYKNTVLLDTNLYPSSDNIWYTKDITPWQPKEGEFVIPKIIKGKAGTYISGFEVCMWTNDDVYECELFIGELPSFLRESR